MCSRNDYADLVAMMHADGSEGAIARQTVQKGIYGTSPLHVAARVGALDALRLMLFFGGENLKLQDSRGRTVLFEVRVPVSLSRFRL